MPRKSKEKSALPDEKYINIYTTECWKCHKNMKVSWVTSQYIFYGPEGFNDLELEKARSLGVLINQVTSKTQGGRIYNANICPHCEAFIGEHFIHDYLYCEELKEKI